MEAQSEFDEAKEASHCSLEICQSVTATEFKTGLGLHKMATFLHRDWDLEGVFV